MSLKVSDVTLMVTQSKRQDLNCDVRRSGSVAFKVSWQTPRRLFRRCFLLFVRSVELFNAQVFVLLLLLLLFT